MVKQRVQLGDVQETLLIPLYFRALETKRRGAIIRDPRAVEIVEGLDFEFEKFNNAWKVQLDVAIRTEIFDKLAVDFLTDHPEAVVVNLGAGLDGRFERVDNGTVTWFDLDLPDTIELREKFYHQSTRNRFLAQSALDPSWLGSLGNVSGKSVLILAEGLFCYLPEDGLRRLFTMMADRLPGAEIVFQSISPDFVLRQHLVPAINQTQAVFRWGIVSGRKLEQWDRRIEFLGEWFFIDHHVSRWGFLQLSRLWPPALKKIREVMKISHLRFRAEAT